MLIMTVERSILECDVYDHFARGLLRGAATELRQHLPHSLRHCCQPLPCCRLGRTCCCRCWPAVVELEARGWGGVRMRAIVNKHGRQPQPQFTASSGGTLGFSESPRSSR